MTDAEAGPGTHKFSHRAMATIFEVFVSSDDPVYANQAAFEAFKEVDRLERELSRFNANSDIARLNALAPFQEMKLGLDAFECLRLAAQYSFETNGAFDPTIGALARCLIASDTSVRTPSEDELMQARDRTGMHRLVLDESEHAVRVLDQVPLVDLGAIGKGYAVDRMVELLEEWGIESMLIHGGTSSVSARGVLPGHQGWPVTLSHPYRDNVVLARLDLKDAALGGSGVKKGRHIIDPRAGAPVAGGRAAWVLAPAATGADAISTALMVMDADEAGRYFAAHTEYKGLVLAVHEDGSESIRRYGLPEEPGASARLTT